MEQSINVRIPLDLWHRIQALADQDKRSGTQELAVILSRAVSEIEADRQIRKAA